jgi:hypothetical protein
MMRKIIAVLLVTVAVIAVLSSEEKVGYLCPAELNVTSVDELANVFKTHRRDFQGNKVPYRDQRRISEFFAGGYEPQPCVLVEYDTFENIVFKGLDPEKDHWFTFTLIN